MSLSSDILDEIDGAEETKGRDGRLSAWAREAEKLEAALRDAIDLAVTWGDVQAENTFAQRELDRLRAMIRK